MRQRGSRLDPLMPEANAIDSTDSWTMPRTVGHRHGSSSIRRTRTVVDSFILAQTRPVARQGKKQQARVNTKSNPLQNEFQFWCLCGTYLYLESQANANPAASPTSTRPTGARQNRAHGPQQGRP